MTRRPTYSNLKKENREVPANAKGMSDVAFKGFQCPTPGCDEWLIYKADDLAGEFTVECNTCNQAYGVGDSVKLYDYALTDQATGAVIEAGELELTIDDYVREAGLYKYCIVCYTLKPLSAFGAHAARKNTQRQGECRMCKTLYNSIKNQSRLPDQHTESAQKRRLLVNLGGTTRFSQPQVRERFGNKCFKCGKDVSAPGEAQFDHTLPVRYFWPMTTENATLLCSEHNGAKGATWPGAFYTDLELRQLALKTGLDYDLLKGPITINPVAIERLKQAEFVDELFLKFAHYMDEVFLIRNRILDMTGFDFFSSSSNISQAWKDKADALRQIQSSTTSE